MIRKLLVVTILCLLFIFPPFGLGQDSNQITWTSPKFLGDGWWQSLALDQQNGLHVSWYGSYDAGDKLAHDVLTYTKRKNDGTWTAPIDAIYTGDGGFTVRNSLAVTSDGLLHVAYRSYVDHFVSSAPIVGSTEVVNWTPPVRVGGNGYYLDMIADRNDVLHLVVSELNNVQDSNEVHEVFAEGAKCFLCYDLFYLRSADGGKTWSDVIPISLEAYSGSDRPKIQEGPSGRLYITWDEGFDWYVSRGEPQDVRMVYSDNQGRTWSKPIIFDGGGRAGLKPVEGSLTEMRDGSLMTVWRYSTEQDSSIYYQISDDVGKTWTEPVAIPGILARSITKSSLDRFELLTDRLGIVHLFAVGQTNSADAGKDALYDITYVPSSEYWVQPQRIYYSADERPEWPEAIVGPSNDISLIWFNRGVVPGSDCNTCVLKVYYSYLPGNMAPVPTVAFRPTQTPFPTATVFQNIEPTSTAFPTLQDVPTSLNVNTEDNFAAQTLLGGMLFSALFCGAVLLLVRLRR